MQIRLTPILLILISLIPTADCLFCSSYCSSNRACWNSSTDGCMACAQTIFALKANATTHNCDLNNQTQIFALDLYGTFSLTNFSVTNTSQFACGAYNLSGGYGATDSIAKTYTNLPLNHYYSVVRFNIMYMGSWTSSAGIVAVLDGVQSSWNYSCPSTTEALCTATDCMRAYQMQENHTATNLTIQISSVGVTAGQTWGVKDLLITLFMCHSSCVTCFGGNSSQCYKCNPGYYLLGNTCVQKCPFYVIESARYCMQLCPVTYYQIGTLCEMCHERCSSCKGPTENDCITTYEQRSAWSSNIEIWIVLILLGVLLIAALIWGLMRHLKKKKLEEEEGGNNNMKEKILISELNVDNGGKEPERNLELKLKPFELKRAGSNPSSMNDSALVINDKDKQEKEMRTLNANLESIEI